MSAVKTDSKSFVSRIPWKEFLKDQLYKLIGFLILSILIIGTIVYSGNMTNIVKKYSLTTKASRIREASSFAFYFTAPGKAINVLVALKKG